MVKSCVVDVMGWLLCLALTLASHNTAHGKVQHPPGSPLPSFSESIDNITVTKGRDITFTCVVKHLGPYKVGWVKADTKAIQAIHHQVVTHNPRVSVTYRDRTTWNLHIRTVQEDDRGLYMCQVNTDPMIAEMAYLDVEVPPEIVDNATSGETTVEEGNSVALTCKAKGYPPPKVSWRREQEGEKIVLRDQGNKRVVSRKGEELELKKVKRGDMGAYLCIAKNGVPPSVSKRIMLKVTFAPLLSVPNHMIGSPLYTEVTIACRVESSPRAVTTWHKDPGEQMIISSKKYDVSEGTEGFYVTHMNLTIRNFTEEDASTYRCLASNSLGASASSVQVYVIQTQKPRVNPKDDLDSRLDNRIPSSSSEDHKDSQLDLHNNNIEVQLSPEDGFDMGVGVGGGGGIMGGERIPEMPVPEIEASDQGLGNSIFPFLASGVRGSGVGVGVWWACVWACVGVLRVVVV